MMANIEHRNSYLNLALNTDFTTDTIHDNCNYNNTKYSFQRHSAGPDQSLPCACILEDRIVSTLILLHLPFYECTKAECKEILPLEEFGGICSRREEETLGDVV